MAISNIWPIMGILERTGFIGIPLIGPSPLQVNFTDQSTGDITSWEWNFGDGSPVSNDQNPDHSFANAGIYMVSLTVSGPLGSDAETKTDYISVTRLNMGIYLLLLEY